jgi:hypothetical protein
MARTFLSLGVLAFAFCLGCSQSPPAEKSTEAAHDDHEHGHDHAHEGHDHGGHDHAHGEHAHGEHGEAAKTYAEAVEKVEAARDTIRDSLAAGDKDKADAALHALGHVLERIPELAKDGALSDEHQEAAKKDADELFDLFGKLDEQIHGDLEITYDTFAEKIDAAVTRLHERIEHKE